MVICIFLHRLLPTHRSVQHIEVITLQLLRCLKWITFLKDPVSYRCLHFIWLDNYASAELQAALISRRHLSLNISHILCCHFTCKHGDFVPPFSLISMWDAMQTRGSGRSRDRIHPCKTTFFSPTEAHCSVWTGWSYTQYWYNWWPFCRRCDRFMVIIPHA